MSIDKSNLKNSRPPDRQPDDPRPGRRTIPMRRDMTSDVLERWPERIDRYYALALTVFVTELVEGRVPRDVAEECLRVRRNGTGELNRARLIEVLAERTGARSPDQLAALGRSIREYQQAMIEAGRELLARREETMSTLPEALLEVYRRMMLFTRTATGDASAVLPRATPQLLALVLNAVRGASERSIPAGHTEGLTDTDVDAVEVPLLELGKQLQAGNEMPTAETLQQDLAAFLTVLQHYDPADPQDDFTIVRLGTRLLIALGGGPEEFFGVFSQLNAFRTLHPVLSQEDFMAEMSRLGQLAERLAADRGVQRTIAELNRGVPEEERTPMPRRLASFCAGNQLMAASEAAVGGNRTASHRRELVQMARLLVERVAQTDHQFEAVPWYWLAVGTAAAEVYQDDELFAAAVKRIGGPEAAVVAAGRIRQHFHRPALQGVIDTRLRSLVIGEWRATPADAEPPAES